MFAIISHDVRLIFLHPIGFKRKVDALAKQKDCEIVREWQRSIINHLYWCVASTPSGNGELVKAKWLSVDNHIHNVHDNHGELFPHCAHAKLRGSQCKKKWLKRRKF